MSLTVVAPNERVLVTGSARVDLFAQTGESLAGRYFRLRLAVGTREWAQQAPALPQAALTHLLARGRPS